MKRYRVTLHFLTRREGGRERPPSGPVYSTVADFLGHRGDDAWSVVIRFKAAPGLPDIEGEIQMLSPEAPNSLLHEGARFRLLEGSHVVATGEVFAAADVPVQHPQRTAHFIDRLKRWMTMEPLEADFEPNVIPLGFGHVGL